MYDQTKIAKIKSWLGSGSINIFGKPFSGKDYQGKKLVDIFGGHLIGGGEILRSNQITTAAKNNLKDGLLIPSQDYFDIVLPYLSKSEFNNQPTFLSAVGRWHGEEEMVINALTQSNHNLKCVIYLRTDDQAVFKRWEALKNHSDREGRHDDTLSILNTRLKEFDDKTMPVIDYYHKNDLLIEIDGSQKREMVTNDIIEALHMKALKS